MTGRALAEVAAGAVTGLWDRRWRAALAVIVTGCCAALLAGCGVPAERSPRAVTAPRSPFPPRGSATPEPADSGPSEERLTFVRDDKLVIVVRRVAAYPTAGVQLRQLIAGPNESERASGLTNALNTDRTSATVHVDGQYAVVEYQADAGANGLNDEILGYGQIVCTLASRPDVTGVVFQQDGEPLGIPRGDGSLSSGPLTAADYTELLVEG